ncbi:MAG: VOC family protein [Flavobacteriaceae bacterium]|nr:VOC family protein [Flavobacteriaceae bacterium]
MLTDINPKLPMRNKSITKDYYIKKLGFKYIGSDDFDEYLIVEKDNLQLHFFLYKDLNPKENYGQVYIRTNDVDGLYQSMLDNKVDIHPNGHLENKN